MSSTNKMQITKTILTLPKEFLFSLDSVPTSDNIKRKSDTQLLVKLGTWFMYFNSQTN